jgi:GNAT superfamily N-acetyltransferase
MSDQDGVRLEGGNMGEVRRVGDEVVKPAGPWTPQVHTAMHRLRDDGVELVPRPLGIDAAGNEHVRFVEGTVPDYPFPDWVWSDDLLVAVASQVRQLHDVAVTVDVPATGWRRGELWPPTLFCHSDLTPYNTVFVGEPKAPRAVAFIDWDFAVVGPREWDLGYLAYRWVSLTPPSNRDGLPIAPAEQRRRLQLLCDAYGDVAPSDVVAWALKRLHDMVGYAHRQAAHGRAEFQATVKAGHPALYLSDARWLAQEYADLLPRDAVLLLRRAEPEESAGVARVLIDSRREAFPMVPAAVHTDEETQQWVAAHLMNTAEVWVATAEAGEVIGVIALHDDWVEQLYVLSEWAGSGVGTRLLEVAKTLSPSGLQLWTFESNTSAQAFYAHHGFTVAEQTDGAGNEERQPDVRMVWRP